MTEVYVRERPNREDTGLGQVAGGNLQLIREHLRTVEDSWSLRR